DDFTCVVECGEPQVREMSGVPCLPGRRVDLEGRVACGDPVEVDASHCRPVPSGERNDRDLDAARLHLGEQRAERGQRLRHDPVERPTAALVTFDQSGLAKYTEVVAHRSLGEIEGFGQVTDTRLTVRLRLDQAEDAE